MRLVIATPLYPPEVGGPAAYAKHFKEGLPQRGIGVELVVFAGVRHFPSGLRHLVYFWRIFSALRHADAILAFDTWSVGIPACFAAWLLRKRFLVRIGGDFLWEQYLDHAAKPVRLSEFYSNRPNLSLKEYVIFIGTRWLLRNANSLLFNTSWQRDLWLEAYGFNAARAHILENEYPEKREFAPAEGRIFISAGRARRLKNIKTLQDIFSSLEGKYPDVKLDTRLLPPGEHRERIRSSYAVVIPSVSEIGPNLAIDAIRYGKPFIAPLDSGSQDRLGGIGIFVDTLDADALREAIEKLLDPTEYEQVRERIRAFSHVHSWDQILDEVAKLLI